jgi:hypothetical protein
MCGTCNGTGTKPIQIYDAYLQQWVTQNESCPCTYAQPAAA